MVSRPDVAGCVIIVSLEDILAPHLTSDITSMIQDAIDKLDDGIQEHVESFRQTPNDFCSNNDSEPSPDEYLNHEVPIESTSTV